MEYSKEKSAILKALNYSDIFDYAPNENELYRDLISTNLIEKKLFLKALKLMGEDVTFLNGYYCLKGRELIIEKRTKRKKYVLKKLKLAKRAAYFLSFIPTIYFIGITGRLCHFDADEKDDIDFFVITKKNTVWSTRIIMLLVLEFLNLRRKRLDFEGKDLICPNLIIDKSAAKWSKDKRDLYTAHEISHILPIFIRNNTYSYFLKQNAWIKKFYPMQINYKFKALKEVKKFYILDFLSLLLTNRILEFIFRKAQEFYMRKKITTEIISPNFIAFHPMDYREKIMSNYLKRIKKIKI